MDTPLGRDIIEHSKIEEIKALLTDEVAYRVYVINTFNQMHEQFKYQEKLLGVYQTTLSAIQETRNNRMNSYDVAMNDCMDKLKRPERGGISGFLDRAWNQFANKFGWVVIAVILWMLLKTFLFGEGPFGKWIIHPAPPSPSVPAERE